MNNPDKKFYIVLGFFLLGMLALTIFGPAFGADIMGAPVGSSRLGPYREMIWQDRPGFGTYSQHYYQRRWSRLCKGGAGRYDAMREAYDLGKPDPCIHAGHR